MKVSYYHPTEKLKLFKAEISEKELCKILADHLGALDLFLDKPKAVDLLRGSNNPEEFIRL
tara:strand:+ start:255 stop:437 length:183 start_codon:yes stop_codon:yes gene_type:complete